MVRSWHVLPHISSQCYYQQPPHWPRGTLKNTTSSADIWDRRTHHLGSPLASPSPLSSSPLRYSEVVFRIAAAWDRTFVTAELQCSWIWGHGKKKSQCFARWGRYSVVIIVVVITVDQMPEIPTTSTNSTSLALILTMASVARYPARIGCPYQCWSA